jgi:aryl-alcohol dehydrogenase
MQITAAVSRTPDSPFTLESVDLDEPRADEVLVRIHATGLCHTDLSSKSRIPGPAVLGHEGVLTQRAAVELGASQTVDPTTEDVAAAFRGATHALDTTGHPDVVATAVSALDTRGMLVVVGLGSRHATIDVIDLLLSGKTIRGCIEGDANPSEFIPELLALHAQGKFPMESIVRPYDAVDIETAVADSLSGEAIKPVRAW